MQVKAEAVLGVRFHELREKYVLMKISVVLSARVLHVPRTFMIAFSLIVMKLSVCVILSLSRAMPRRLESPGTTP